MNEKRLLLVVWNRKREDGSLMKINKLIVTEATTSSYRKLVSLQEGGEA